MNTLLQNNLTLITAQKNFRQEVRSLKRSALNQYGEYEMNKLTSLLETKGFQVQWVYSYQIANSVTHNTKLKVTSPEGFSLFLHS